MSWKDEMGKEMEERKKYDQYFEKIINDLNERMFFDELAIRAIIKIITIDQKFVSPKQYTTVVDQVYKELTEEMKKRQMEAALKKENSEAK